jgi:hypothetical protein
LRAADLPAAFPSAKEEEFVANEAPAHVGAELIEGELVLCAAKKLRASSLSSQELEQRAMKFVSPDL